MTCDETTDQSEVVAFLKSPASWPSRPASVDVIETHGAMVFLAGTEVLKVKRAVKLPYLDFSTLGARRHFCQREIEINGGAASGLYRGCVPMTREASGRLAIGGAGDPVEWAVHMHRFEQDRLFCNIVRHGGVPIPLAEALADAVFKYHCAAPVAADDRTAETAEGVLTSLSRFASGPASQAIRPLRALVETQLSRSASVRSARASSGRIRRCHGDLHLANIVVWHDVPVLFDALEFDEDLATIDTLYDLAFLIMDLARHDAALAANTVLNRYLWRSKDLLDIEGLAALPLYLGLRAAIRALVAFDRAEACAGEGESIYAHAIKTLELARKNLSPPGGRLVAVGGLSGTGKTTLARALAPCIGATPGALLLRTDLERKALAGLEPAERLPPPAYTREASRAVYERITARAEAALRSGHSVILDAVFADPSERSDAEMLASRLGVPFAGLWLEGRPEALKTRVAERRNDASDATPEIVDQQLRYDTGAITWHRIDASGSVEQTLTQAALVLEGNDSL
ncbi:MAG: AAA family ATPase [Hyphomicrobium sp.]